MKIIKRILLIILIIIAIMCIAGYFFIKSAFQIKGVVVRNYGRTILVMEKDKSLTYIPIPENNKLKFKKDQEVLIQCKFNMEPVNDTYPSDIDIKNLKNIKIVKEKSNIEIPQETLRKFYSSSENISVIVNEFSTSGISFIIKDTNEYKCDYEASNTYDLSKIENNLYRSCKRVPENNNNKKEVTYKKTDNDTIINTYNWENIYGKLESGKYRFETNTEDSYLYITIKFTVDENGKITYEKPICMLIG